MSWIKWIIYEVVLSAKCKKRLKIVFYFRNTISFIEPVGNYTFTNFNFRGGKISIVKLLPHAFYICFYVTIFLKFYMMQRKKKSNSILGTIHQNEISSTLHWLLFLKNYPCNCQIFTEENNGCVAVLWHFEFYILKCMTFWNVKFFWLVFSMN